MDNGRTPLMVAMRNGNIQEALRCLEHEKSSVHQQDGHGKTALHHALEANHDAQTTLALVRALIESQADSAPSLVRVADAFGRTPLHLVRGRTQVMELLLASGADPNAADARGSTCLHVAAGVSGAGGVEGVRLLLAHGADPAVVDREGQTPTVLAVNDEVAHMLGEALLAGKKDFVVGGGIVERAAGVVVVPKRLDHHATHGKPKMKIVLKSSIKKE